MRNKSWCGMIPQLVRLYINRQFLIYVRNIFRFLVQTIQTLYLFLTMSMSNPKPEPQPSDSEAPPFDPTQPSLPISYPIKTLQELESRSYFDSFHYPFNKASVPIPNGSPSSCSLPNRRRLLVCHDMAGGYVDDKWVQGGTNQHAYAIWHWHLIDVFVYFSHTLVTLPPPCWTNTAHRHGVKVLGTFITEWDEGRAVCDELLSTKESAQMYAERLAELAAALGFDGWLEDYPRLSAAVAGDRKFDVYMGIDVFGRNTYGGGQWNANVALDVLRKDDVSAAIFAPGWVYETKQPPDFETAQNSWWGLVEKSWGLLQNYPGVLPFYTNFDQGRGYHISVDGDNALDATWCNISCQGIQPLLEFAHPTNSIQVLVDLKEASYSGGGNITFKGSLEEHTYFERKIFQGEFLLSEFPVHFIYSVKSDGNSSLGIKLEFTSTSDKRMSVLLASQAVNHFSSKFSKVIMTREHKKFSPGWVINEGTVTMNGYTLTEIHAVCYRSADSPFNEMKWQYRSDSSDGTVASLSDYFAVLGHITIKTSDYKSDFPLSTSWLVDGEYIKWTSGPQGSRTLNVKISWKLKDGKNYLFPKYNLYLAKLSKQADGNPGTFDHVKEYLGVAHVNCFYVSDFKVPFGTSSLKFIIQVCNVDGTIQELDESPYYQLEVEGP